MAGCELVEVSRAVGACASSRARRRVLRVAAAAGDMGLGAGDVWQISCLNRIKVAGNTAAAT